MATADVIRAYLRERYPARVFVPLALAVAVCGAAAFRRVPDAPLASAGIAWLLILAFRVWDDWMDRDADRTLWPDRVMVRGHAARPFLILGVAAAALALALLVLRVLLVSPPASAVGVLPGHAMPLAAACVLLAVWYRARRANVTALANTHVLALKYPLIAAVAAAPAVPWPTPAWTPDAGAPLLALYLGVTAWDSLTDARVRAHGAARWLVAGELALLACLPVVALTGGFFG